MRIRSAIVTVMVLVLVAGAVTGCRNSRRAAAGQNSACQPCPPQPCPPQTYAPQACAPQPCPPQPYCPPACPPPTCYQPQPVCPPSYGAPALPPLPSTTYGSPDAGVAAMSPGGFPAAQPAPRSDVMTTIEEERRTRELMQQELVAAQERLRLAEQAIVAPQICEPATGMGVATRGGGSGQAGAFAAALRTKSCGEVEQQGDVVVIRLSDAFVSGSERLKGDPTQMTTLLATAEELSRTPGAFVEVVGHSDGEPIRKSKWRDNVHLSQERAQTVANALAKQGVPAGRLTVTGRGSAEPVVYPESTSRDRARNRRVEIRVQF